MKIEKPLLLWMLITMVPKVLKNFDAKGNFSHSIISRRWMRLLDSRLCIWTQILSEGTFLDFWHDDLKNFPIFKNFGKSRNQFWDPPKCKIFEFWKNCMTTGETISPWCKFQGVMISMFRPMVQFQWSQTRTVLHKKLLKFKKIFLVFVKKSCTTTAGPFFFSLLKNQWC